MLPFKISHHMQGTYHPSKIWLKWTEFHYHIRYMARRCILERIMHVVHCFQINKTFRPQYGLHCRTQGSRDKPAPTMQLHPMYGTQATPSNIEHRAEKEDHLNHLRWKQFGCESNKWWDGSPKILLAWCIQRHHFLCEIPIIHKYANMCQCILLAIFALHCTATFVFTNRWRHATYILALAFVGYVSLWLLWNTDHWSGERVCEWTVRSTVPVD